MRNPGPRKKGGQSRGLLAALTLTAFAAGSQVATQCFAHLVRGRIELGTTFHGMHAPWRVVEWSESFGDVFTQELHTSRSCGLLASSVLMIAVAAIAARSRERANQFTHGSATFASIKDICAAGLLPRSRNSAGVYVGAIVDGLGRLRYLRHDGPEHVLSVAPTRSGKGFAFVLPTLLSWSHSALVLDLKGELSQLTSGWRKRYARNKILAFEPAHRDSVCWNPLDEIDIDSPSAIGDAQNLTTMLVDPDGRGLHDHWTKTAQALLTGMALYVLRKAKAGGPAASIPQIDAELSNPHRGIHDLWTEMASMDAVCPIVAATGKDMIDRPEDEGGSVLSTAKSYLSLYRDPVVARNISRSDFRVLDLMNHSDPVTLYVVTQIPDKDRLRPLVRLLLNSVVRKLASRMEFVPAPAPRWSLWGVIRGVAHARATHKHRLLMMLDEFPALGKLPILQESLGFLAGFGIKVFMVCQDLNQLKSRETGYGPDETITANCHVQIAFPTNNLQTAEHLSRLTGVATVQRMQITRGSRGERSRTLHEVQRPLMTPDECMRMPSALKDEKGHITKPGDMLISVAGFPVIYGRQPFCPHDPVFAARMAIPPVSTDVLRPSVSL